MDKITTAEFDRDFGGGSNAAWAPEMAATEPGSGPAPKWLLWMARLLCVGACITILYPHVHFDAGFQVVRHFWFYYLPIVVCAVYPAWSFAQPGRTLSGAMGAIGASMLGGLASLPIFMVCAAMAANQLVQ